MLNQLHVDQLFQFCRKHYIHYYEVQCELVDHLANDIENRMSADSQLNFDNALDKAYNAFGGWKGMQKMQEEKRRHLTKYQSKLKWRIFFSYFKLPRIILTLLLIAASYSIVTVVPQPWSRIFIVVSILLAIFHESFGMWKVNRLIREQRDKLMLFNNSGTFSFAVASFICLNHLINILLGAIWPSVFEGQWVEGITIFLPIYVILANSYRKFMEEVYREAVKNYPTLFTRAAS